MQVRLTDGRTDGALADYRVQKRPQDTMGGILQKMLQAFYTKKLEVVLVGLENRYVVASPSGGCSSKGVTLGSLLTGACIQWQDDAAERHGHGPPS